MALVAAGANPLGLLQKLSLDSLPKTHEAEGPAKQASGSQNDSSNGGAPNVPIHSNLSSTSILPDSGNCFLPGYAHQAYYHGGYDRAIGDWGDFSRYANQDGQGVYGEIYQGYGYAPYSTYPSNVSAVSTMGHNSQLYGQQQYQYPAPLFQSLAPGSTFQMPNPPSSHGEISTSIASNQPSIALDTAKNSSGASGNTYENNGLGTKPSCQNAFPTLNASNVGGDLPGGFPSTSYQDPRFGFDGMWSSLAWFDGPSYSNGQQKPATLALSSTSAYNANNSSTRNQNQQHVPHIMGMHAPRPSGMGPSASVISRMHQTDRFYGGSGHGNGFRYGNWDLVAERNYKPQGQRNEFFGYVSRDGFIELNRGPRAGCLKNQRVPRLLPTTATDSQNLSLKNEHPKVHIAREQYNREDFLDKYSQAKFFIIKSYSEDHIHRSIKYNVWASTPNGNKKLDAGYMEAQEKAVGCPVFLFFSANSSGQFIGVAEMVGPVDFNKTVEYWQQDKWTGCFPVKWHIIKDVPNSILKHITLDNNENKPVTKSRDTQEVNLEQGLQMIKIFKEYVSNTSILDDFEFYENRQSLMEEKKTQQQQQKQVWAGKASHAPVEGEKVNANEMHRLQLHSALHEAQERGISAAASGALDVQKSAVAVEKHCVDCAADGVVSG